jgi:peptidase S41-like protein/tricorn protease-like protein
MRFQRELRSIAGCIFLLTSLLPPPPAKAQSADGLWLTDGYGLLLEVKGPKIKAFEITSLSCLPSWSAERDPFLSDGSKTVFIGGRGTVTIMPGSSDGRESMHLDFSVSTIGMRRVAIKPETCSEPIADTPQNNYAVFWQTFAEQYALFPQYRIDWTAVDHEYRPLITSSTRPEELFQILAKMVDGFHNAHIDVRAKSIRQEYWGYRPSDDILQSKHAETIARIIESKYVQGNIQTYCNKQLEYGMLRDFIGLLRILSFENYTKEALESALDQIFTGSSRLKGLIIDARINEGGSDLFGVEIASRLTRARYLAYSKVARNNVSGPLHFTEPEPVWVPGNSQPGFSGNVVLLVGSDTLSAGETFAMALMNRTPRVIRVGDDTQGVFSDKLRRRLPNGWLFALPNEIYLTEEGQAFDVKGVPPDIRVQVFASQDVAQGRDRGIEKASELLRSHNR